MGKEFAEIDESIRDWVGSQKMFFVATAPLSHNGLINCSPKGMDTFRILGPRTIAYLDLTGSGIETIAHLRENNRIVIMMCAFEGTPKIFRFYGKGQVFEKGSAPYEEHISSFDELIGTRAIIHIDLDCIRDSCGYSIPLYDYLGDRDVLSKWSEKGDEGVKEYVRQNNQSSLDGLPGIEAN